MQRKIGVREKKVLQMGVRDPKSLGNPDLRWLKFCRLV